MLSLERDKHQIKKTKELLSLMAKGMSESEAMIECEYQEALANNPDGITETAAWKLVMDTFMPDKHLARRHRALLDKVDHSGQPDTQAVGKGLELAYKIKGKLIDKVDVTSGGKELPATIVFNFPTKRKEPEFINVEVVE